MANISGKELTGFRELAKSYSGLTEQQIKKLIKNKELVEICHDSKK